MAKTVTELQKCEFGRLTLAEKVAIKNDGPPRPMISRTQKAISNKKEYLRTFNITWYDRVDWLCGCEIFYIFRPIISYYQALTPTKYIQHPSGFLLRIVTGCNNVCFRRIDAVYCLWVDYFYGHWRQALSVLEPRQPAGCGSGRRPDDRKIR